jgi:hypothetical protein
MTSVTEEMKLAMAALHRQGIVHYATSGHQLDCGCRAVAGWDTGKCEPFAGIEPCAEHREEANQAVGVFQALPASERLATELLAELLEKEIERGKPTG